MKSFTSLGGLSGELLSALVERSVGFAAQLAGGHRTSSELSGRTVASLFFEPSTRTRLSFEMAGHRLGAQVLTFDPETSSTRKGESLQDTVMTVSAMGPDILVVRHTREGVPREVQEWTGRPVVNAGDGRSEHPTQTLIDAVTLVRHFGSLDGLTMGIVGDIRNSRVAGSHLIGMPTLGLDLTLIGPEEMLPDEPVPGVPMTSDLDGELEGLDVVYLLRIQAERGGAAGSDYHARFGMDATRVKRLKDSAVVMHPGPINRGVEIEGEVADGPRSLILGQVANGVPTRMAVLAALGEDLT